MWLAPEQLRIIQVKDSDEVVAFVSELREQAAKHGIRFTVDDTNESVGKKIRAASQLKVPYSLVIGEKEVEQGTLTPRVRADLAADGREDASYDADVFFAKLAEEVTARVRTTTL